MHLVSAFYRKIIWHVGIVAFVVLSSSVYGQSAETLFENGNAAYNNGDYEKAIAVYEAVLDDGMHSAALYYNLANAYYRLNAVAESIYFFEKAKQLTPQDADIEVNMRFAKNMTIDAIEPLPRSQLSQIQQRVLDWNSVNGWGVSTVVLAWVFFACFLLYVFHKNPSYKRLFFSLALGMLLMGLISGIMGGVKDGKQTSTEYAILFSEKINVWSEPNERSDMQFELHEGTKVLLLDRLQEWQKIQIANGSEGWLKNAELRSLLGE